MSVHIPSVINPTKVKTAEQLEGIDNEDIIKPEHLVTWQLAAGASGDISTYFTGLVSTGTSPTYGHMGCFWELTEVYDKNGDVVGGTFTVPSDGQYLITIPPARRYLWFTNNTRGLPCGSVDSVYITRTPGDKPVRYEFRNEHSYTNPFTSYGSVIDVNAYSVVIELSAGETVRLGTHVTGYYNAGYATGNTFDNGRTLSSDTGDGGLIKIFKI